MSRLLVENILDVCARQVLDSRGNPTVEVDVFTEKGVGSAMVPSGASTGSKEAVELRDGGKSWGGLGVSKAVKNVNTIIKKKIVGLNVFDQAHIDGELIHLDGTKNKSRLGANAILGVSIAVARAAAVSKGISLFEYLHKLFDSKNKMVLPIPFANVINGGKHASGKLEFQEFMIAPVKAKNFSDAVKMVSETYHALAKILTSIYGKSATHIGDEGGFAPPVSDADEALKLLTMAIKQTGYSGKIFLAMDPAASEFYNSKHKSYLKDNLVSSELTDLYLSLAKKYPLISLEDPFDENDVESFVNITKKTSRRKQFQIVADDLTVSNPLIIQRAISEKWCNSLLLKVNQIGTITESLRSARLAKKAGWSVMVSHRSGETEDPFIADLSVAISAGQIKLGAPARSDRTSKYNQLLRIEEFLGKKGNFAKF